MRVTNKIEKIKEKHENDNSTDYYYIHARYTLEEDLLSREKRICGVNLSD